MHAYILKGNPGQTHTQQMDCCSHNSLLCASVVLGLAVAVSVVCFYRCCLLWLLCHLLSVFSCYVIFPFEDTLRVIFVYYSK